MAVDARSGFQCARNYVLFYGRGHEEQIRRFDVAILEPAAWNSDEIALMKDSGVVVLAYLSLLEPQPGETLDGFEKTDFLWGSSGRIIDPRSPRCTRRALAKAAGVRRLLFDGLFIDTVSLAEQHGLAGAGGDVVQADMLARATAQVIVNLRQGWPGAVLCQNMGLEMVCHLTADIVDGFGWENFNRCPRSRWFWKMLEWLAGLGLGKKVLLLGESDVRDESQDDGPEAQAGTPGASMSEISLNVETRDLEMMHIGRHFGFLTYLAPSGYSSGVNLEWLKIAAHAARSPHW